MTTAVLKPLLSANGGQNHQQLKLGSSRYVPLAKAIEPKTPAFLRQKAAPNAESRPTQTLRFVNFTNPEQCKSNKNRRLVRSTASKSSGRPLEAQKAKAQARLRNRKSRNCVSLTGTFSSNGAGLPFAKVKQKAATKDESPPVLSVDKYQGGSCDPFKVYPACYSSLDVGIVSSCRPFRH